ncbi:MAG: hypothetical protein ABJZ55_23870 [Fuerstiella sp.]
MSFKVAPFKRCRLAILLATCWLLLLGCSSIGFAQAVGFAQTELSREDALQADLAEAIEMLESSQFQLLTFDFMPADFASEIRRMSMQKYGDPDSTLTEFPQQIKNQLVSELKAAQSGKMTWNRDKSLVWIQFTTKPVEVVPAQKPGYVPPSLAPETAATGLGADVNDVLEKAIGLLESKNFIKFGRAMLPVEQAAELNSDVAIQRWVHRLETHPAMVNAMIRDLKTAQVAAQSGTKRQSDDRVSIESQSAGVILQLVKVADSWRLSGLSAAEQTEYQQLANSEIAASVIPAQVGTLVLTFTENRWRLMAMPTRIPNATNAKQRR